MEERIIFVDGFAIRNTLDADFAFMHRHSTAMNLYLPKFYIPEGEIWIDGAARDEAEFLMAVDAFTTPTLEHSYEELREEAKRVFRPEGDMPEYVRRSEERDQITIRHVDGAIVRRYLDPEFAFGGHDLVYDYIPQNEIWIEEAIVAREQPFILHHETIEREHMQGGASYDTAHEYAVVSEKALRRAQLGTRYPGDADYPWHGMTNGAIFAEHYAA